MTGDNVKDAGIDPRVVSKLELALDIGLSSLSPELKAIEIRDRIGTGLHIAEAVPAAFGILASRRGDAMETLIDCVNIGYDTDTLATIAGGIAGALSGSEAFPEHFLPTLESVNGFFLYSVHLKNQFFQAYFLF